MMLVGSLLLHSRASVFSPASTLFFLSLDRLIQIWVRNYQILEEQATNAHEAHRAKKQTGQTQAKTSLVEIGPRFVLNPIRIFRGSFGGQTLYHNASYVSPNELRAQERQDKGQTYLDRKQSQQLRKERLQSDELRVPEDPLDSVFR